jgi:hypothetical protein
VTTDDDAIRQARKQRAIEQLIKLAAPPAPPPVPWGTLIVISTLGGALTAIVFQSVLWLLGVR